MTNSEEMKAHMEKALAEMSPVPHDPNWGRLTAEQVEFRNESLVRNLRYKFKEEIAPYSDATIVEAYDNWFLSADDVGNDHEREFLGLLPDLPEANEQASSSV
jgi:hypothetical protein